MTSSPRAAVLAAAIAGLGPTRAYFSGARVLVTGARGFFGRYVVDALLELNGSLQTKLHVFALDAMVPGVSPANDNWNDWRGRDDITFLRHDVRHDLRTIEGTRLTHVWHLAGIASPHWYQKLPNETIQVAVDGTRNMLALARGHDARFLFTSSSEVYQTATVVPTPETYIGAIPSLMPRSCYDVSKLMAETLCYVAAPRQDVSIVRIFNSFGPGMGEHDKRILPRIASAMRAGRSLPVYGKAAHLPRRTYTPVANTLLGFLLVAAKGETIREPRAVTSAPGVYNVGLDSPEVTVVELLERARAVTGAPHAYELAEPPDHYASEPLRRCPDISKLRSLGFRPCMCLDVGLEHFFRWADENYTGLS